MENPPVFYDGKGAAVCQVVVDWKTQRTQPAKQEAAVGNGEKFCTKRAQGQGNLAGLGEEKMDPQRVCEMDDLAVRQVVQKIFQSFGVQVILNRVEPEDSAEQSLLPGAGQGGGGNLGEIMEKRAGFGERHGRSSFVLFGLSVKVWMVGILRSFSIKNVELF